MAPVILPPSRKRIIWGDVALAATAAGVAGAYAGASISWHFAPLPESADTHLWHWTLGLLSISGFDTAGWQQYVAYMQRMSAAGLGWEIPLRMAFSGLCGASAAFFAGRYAAHPVSGYTHIRGRKLYEGEEAIKAARRELAASKTGILLHPLLQISEDLETKHFLFSGGTGSGKSVIAWLLMLEADRRGDRKIIFDYKGITEAWPDSARPGVICCPWDRRGVVWHIAADVQTKQQAKNIAARLIVESTDPLWSNAARQILAAVIISLQQEKRTDWTWRDLANAVTLPQSELAKIAKKYHPEALRAVAEASKTTDGILINMASFMSVIYDLADAWGDRKGTLSITRWLKTPASKVRTIIFKMSDDFEQLTKAYLQAAIGIIGSVVSSLPDCHPTENRLWIFSDEHPRLGKVEGWSKFMEVGRSKSMRVVTIFQSPNQLREIYGREVFESWVDMVPTKIFCRSDGDAAKWIAEQAGDAEVERMVDSVSTGAQGTTTSRSFQREMIPVLLPSQVSNELGPGKKGCLAILHGLNNEYILKWPYPPVDPKTRKATVLADWCKAFEDWGDAEAEEKMSAGERRQRSERRWEQRLQTMKAEHQHELVIDDIATHLPPELQAEPETAAAEPVADAAAEELATAVAETALGGGVEALKIGLDIIDAVSAIEEQSNPGGSPAVAGKRRRLVRKRITNEQEIN